MDMIYTQTYWCWYQYLSNTQIKKITPDIIPDKDDWLIVFQPYSAELQALVASVINKFDYSKRVLVHYEGRYRQPHGFKLRYQQQFGRIYTYNSTDIDCDTVKYMPIPMWINENDCYSIGNRSKLICSVITNCAKDGEPRGFIIDKLKTLGMDVYGGAGQPVPGDNQLTKDVKSCMTRYQAKLNVMSNYVFAFTIENQLDLGHVTEKIFDAIAAGCIPVYLGAFDICKLIPKDCFINYRDFWSEEDLMWHIEHMPTNKIQNYQKSIMKHQKQLVGIRTFESCMRFLCKDLGFECEAPYYNEIINLSSILSTKE